MRIYRTENNSVTKYNTACQVYRANNFAKNTANAKHANVAFTGRLADWFLSIFGSAEAKARIKAEKFIKRISADMHDTEQIRKNHIKRHLGIRIAQLEYRNKKSETTTKEITANNSVIKLLKSELENYK